MVSSVTKMSLGWALTTQVNGFTNHIAINSQFQGVKTLWFNLKSSNLPPASVYIISYDRSQPSPWPGLVTEAMLVAQSYDRTQHAFTGGSENTNSAGTIFRGNHPSRYFNISPLKDCHDISSIAQILGNGDGELFS